VDKYLTDNHTNTETRIVITQHLKAWLQCQPLPDMAELIPEASRALHQAVREQNAIGWEHWFKGRLTMTWGTLYNHDLRTTNHGMRNQTAEKWSKNLISMTWDFMLESWTIRNEIEHSTEGDQTQNIKDRLIQKIMWNQEKIVHFPTSYLRNLTQDQIQDLPLGNLKMLDSQVQTLMRAVRVRPDAQNNT
jgi:hypothetical protein